MRLRTAVAVFLFLLPLPLLAQGDYGEVSFANSGAPEAQAPFLRGLALLHDFEYAPAAESFRKAQEIDPSFAMAYWGEAMTFTHPIWFQQDAPAARAALKRLGATPEERLAKAKTEREREYLRAVDVLYGDGTKEERDFKYSEAMAALHAKYPDDIDATAFYALSILGTSHHGRDLATYMRAAAILEEVFPTHQKHPGVLHYLIHSYDDPIHAPLGMRAARLYGNVAPKAGHALHMTSHIFIAMGMWDEVIDANRRANAVVDEARRAKGASPVACGHYTTWLHYALMQEKKFDEGRQLLDRCRAAAFGTDYKPFNDLDTADSRIDAYLVMRALHAGAGGTLTKDDLVVLPEKSGAETKFSLAYSEFIDAVQRKDVAAVRSSAARMAALKSDVMKSIENRHVSDPSVAHGIEIELRQSEAMQMAFDGKRDEAIAMLQKTAAEEQELPFEFGPPSIQKPTYELLAEQLLAAGRASEAADAYRAALARLPGRTVALQGLARAEKK